MNKRIMRIAVLAGTFSAASFLSGCGDEITEVTNVGMSSVKAYKDLVKCNDKNEGELVFVKDSGAVYLCSNKKWNDINGSDGKNGKNGVGCTSKSVEDGVKITCGDSDPVVIKNGTSADDDACKITSDKDGVVTFECGDKTTKLYKGICDVTPYDPEIQFCYENELYDFCNGKDYNPAKKFCYEKKLYDLCNGKDYDPAKKFCYAKELYDLCDGKSFAPTEKFCYKKKLYDLCDGESFNPTEKFCSDEKLYEFCDGKDYDPTKYDCIENKLQTEAMCGSVKYSAPKQFCAVRGDAVEGVYKKVRIRNQTWMAENLNYKTENSWCGGGNETTEGDCATFGRLYTWAAAVGKSEDKCGEGYYCTTLGSGNVQGACPDGWHVPTKTEWETLITAVGGENVAGMNLKATTLWDGKGSTKDTYGFSAIPAGYRYTNGYFGDKGYRTFFWSASQDEDGVKVAYNVELSGGESGADLTDESKSTAISVRCLKD